MARVDTGDAIIGSALLGIGIMLGLSVAGVPFLDWIAEVLLVVAGIMMMRGSLGAHPRVGALLMVAGPALLVLPPFFPALSMVLPIVVIVGLVLGAVSKFFSAW